MIMNRKKLFRRPGAFLLSMFLCLSFSATVLAEELPCRSATATGHYRHPLSGEIEDSGGSDSEALGQSMVTNVVDPDALIEGEPSGGYYLSVRFHLMNNLSDIHFAVQEPGEDAWEDVFHEQTASGDDQGDLRLPIRSEDTIVRADCYVEAMGRSVIFYITVSDFEEGNRGGFVRSDSGITGSGSSSEAGTGGSGSDVLEGVAGVTTGGANAVVASQPASAAVTTQTASAEVTADGGTEEEPQELNVSSEVWWMLFLVVFCANLLAGLSMTGAKLALDRFRRQEEKAEDVTEEAQDDNLEDFLQGSWEEAENGEEC